MPIGLEQKAVRAGSGTVSDNSLNLPPINANGVDPLLLPLESDDPWRPKWRKG